MSRFQIFRKVMQLDVVNKPYRVTWSNRCMQPVRPSSNLALQKCYAKPVVLAAPITNISTQTLQKPLLNNIQSRSSSSDHVRLWIFEKLISAALPILIPVALMLENPVADGLLAVATVMHVHWGLEAIVVDYARPSVVGPIIPKISYLALNLLSISTLAGLLVLIYNGPGIAKSIKKFWAITSVESKKSE